MATVITRATITGPRCGTAREEEMAADACRCFYVCTGCGARLKPKPGDCCVFCSSATCPPRQAQGGGRCG